MLPGNAEIMRGKKLKVRTRAAVDSFKEIVKEAIGKYPAARRAYGHYKTARTESRKIIKLLQLYLGRFLFHIRNVLLLGKPIDIEVSEVSFRLKPTGAVAADKWTKRSFEFQELRFILDMLEPGMTFFDLGANVGLFSIPAAKKVGGGLVYAFEPCSWTYELLRKNVSLNSIENVRTYRLALGDYTGEAVMHLYNRGRDGHNTIGKPINMIDKVIGQETVAVMTLDDFIESNGISRIDVMKVDIEGCELLMFRGAQELLAREDAPAILYEGYSWNTMMFNYQPVEIMRLLEDCGYELFILNTDSGKVAKHESGDDIDAMVVALKPYHLDSERVREVIGCES